jgi:hypothetical protein
MHISYLAPFPVSKIHSYTAIMQAINSSTCIHSCTERTHVISKDSQQFLLPSLVSLPIPIDFSSNTRSSEHTSSSTRRHLLLLPLLFLSSATSFLFQSAASSNRLQLSATHTAAAVPELQPHAARSPTEPPNALVDAAPRLRSGRVSCAQPVQTQGSE